ncbi:DnaT-like ssDNA-binding protein [Bradyrhizobium sp. HKCCYLS2038]|uniref:DnaT-like ssDNA-binding protein n=1 Tax=Bradyrhizobium sp. HKCCYLS2038 TaxID=3420764 RepID=UPI003EBBB693
MSLDSTPGGAAAESYFSIAEADTYFAARGNAAWAAATTTAKEQAARAGTQYLENTYRTRWVGLTAAQTQALAWPRVDGQRGGMGRSFGYGYTFPLYDINGWAIDSTTIPAQIKYAAMQAALLALGGVSLEPTLERGGQIHSISKGVGPLSKSIVYVDGAPARDTYTAIEGYLRGLVQSSGNVKLVRA